MARGVLILLLAGCSSTPQVSMVAPEEGASVVAGEPIDFVAEIEDEAPVADLRYQLWADPGGELDTTNTFAGTTATLRYSRSLLIGEALITLRVTDPDGQVGTDTLTLSVVENSEPTVTFRTTAPSVAADVELAIEVEVADPDEADLTVLALDWEGADGPANPDSTGFAVGTARFDEPGAGAVTVSVTDPAGAIDVATLELTVYDADDDGDGWPDTADGGTDCDDGDATIFPGATERCDGVDQDCDGEVDDGPEDGAVYYPDADADGWGSDVGEASCAQPDGWLTTSGDCDDGDAAVHPEADETCDGVDEDCDGSVDEDAVDGDLYYADTDEDGWGDADTMRRGCEGGDGVSETPGDCDDGDPAVSPDGAEVCDAADTDEDCDGLADDDDPSATGETTWYRDADRDGYGDTSSTACDAPSGYVATGGDCDDGSATANPGETEVCEDGEDNDCDGDDPTCLLDGSLSLADADARWEGASGDVLGPADGVGDQDGDGLPDLVLGAPGYSAGSYAGAIYVVSGLDTGGSVSGAVAKRYASAASDEAGYAIAGAGDLDGDGWDDVLLGAYGDDNGGSGSGGAFLLLGPISGTAALSGDATFVGESAGDAAGWAVAAAGDTDGDGDPEILVGAPDADSGGTSSGRAYLIEGPVSGTVDLSAADALLTGESASDRAGYALAGLGDTDGDGLDDVGIGAPGESGAGKAGGAWVFLGPVSTADLSAADAELSGVATDDAAGGAVGAAGDVDGDGYADLLVAGTGIDTAGSESGGAYLVLGPVATASLSTADAVITGVDSQDHAGCSARGAGDLDDDGHDDVLVGAYYEGTVGTGAGAAYVLYGPISGSVSLGAADAAIYGETARDAAGRNVGPAGDVDGDGFDDLFVGATGWSSGKGAVYVLKGGGG